MAVSVYGAVHATSMGVKRALSESEDSEYSEDESHYPTLLVSPALRSHQILPEWKK